jgi:hypothetical protein
MKFFINNINKVYFGSNIINKIYIGITLIYSSSSTESYVFEKNKTYSWH